MLQTIILAAIGFVLLRFVAGFLSKLIGILLLVVGASIFMYYQGIGPFKKNYLSIEELELKYCFEGRDQDKCDCIVQTIKTDLLMRFGEEEMASWENNRIKGAYALQKSLSENKEEIAICLAKRDAISDLKEFQRDLLPFDDLWTRRIVGLVQTIQNSATEQFDEMKEQKEEIDRQY